MGYWSSCCCDDTIPPEPAVDNCAYVYKAIPLSQEAKTLPPFREAQDLVFRHRLGDTVTYVLDSLVIDTVHFGCDTLYALEQQTAYYSSNADQPAQPSLKFQLIQQPINYTGKEMFAFSSGNNFNPIVYVTNFSPVNRKVRSKYHDKIVDCDTAFSSVYELRDDNWEYGGFYKIYYSREKGVEAMIGGTNSFDYWVRIYE